MDSLEYSDRVLHGPELQMSGDPRNSKDVHYYDDHHLQRTADARLLLLRLLTLGFSCASLIVMVTDNHPIKVTSADRIRWFDFDAYRFVFAANCIVCIYSLAEIGLGIWYLFVGATLMPDGLAHWFDYGHDQGFAYLVFSACSAGTVVAHGMRNGLILVESKYTCKEVSPFCTQAEIAIGMGYAAFLFIAVSSLFSGLRLARWLMHA